MADAEAPDLVLGSRSPRRRLLLAMLGVQFQTVAADIDESRYASLDPRESVQRCAEAKAVIAMRVANAGLGPDDPPVPPPALGVDTEVIDAGRVVGKPHDEADARAILRQLSGRTVEVVSGLALIVVAEDRTDTALAVSRVAIADLDDATIDAYLATGEAMDKAGALAVQGAAKDFVTVIEGSRSNVFGLPLRETAALLGGAGIAVRHRRIGGL